MENNDFDNIPEKFQEIKDPFATPPQASYNNQPPESKPEMGIGDWLIVFLISIIPCVNIIMWIVWAASNENKTRRNYARAYLIFIGIMFVVSMVLWLLFMGAVFGIMDAMGGW